MNTRINYLYRDADNYKMQNSCVISGTITLEQIAAIMDTLEDDEYFIPHMVGLPEQKFDTYDPQSDHPYFELGPESFEPTKARATVELTVAELVAAFAALKGKWHCIEPERALELLNILIDEKVNDEGCKAGPVVERLADLGFSKSELLALKFAESDINDAFSEEEEDEEDV